MNEPRYLSMDLRYLQDIYSHALTVHCAPLPIGPMLRVKGISCNVLAIDPCCKKGGLLHLFEAISQACKTKYMISRLINQMS